MKSKFSFKMSNNNSSYNLDAISKEQYAAFYKECKAKHKSETDPMVKLRFKYLEKCYKILEKYGVPFNVANIIYPQICKELADFQGELNKYAKGNNNG